MMDSDEYENGGQEAAPIDMLAAYFEAHGWSYDQVGEDEIVASTQGPGRNMSCAASGATRTRCCRCSPCPTSG